MHIAKKAIFEGSVSQ